MGVMKRGNKSRELPIEVLCVMLLHEKKPCSGNGRRRLVVNRWKVYKDEHGWKGKDLKDLKFCMSFALTRVRKFMRY